MSFKEYTKGLERIAYDIKGLTDKDIEDKLLALGFNLVPDHFITYLRDITKCYI